jgi:CyaY protein
LQDAEFQEKVDELFFSLEDLIDGLDQDLDIDTTGGLLSIELADGSAVIVSRQVGNHEVWVAAKSGGFHLALADDQWLCSTTGETLEQLLGRVLSEQLGFSVSL